jgi:hypothetical protein
VTERKPPADAELRRRVRRAARVVGHSPADLNLAIRLAVKSLEIETGLAAREFGSKGVEEKRKKTAQFHDAIRREFEKWKAKHVHGECRCSPISEFFQMIRDRLPRRLRFYAPRLKRHGFMSLRQLRNILREE